MATFTNKATLTYNGRSVDSNIVTGTVNEALTVIKSALDETYAEGTRLTYVVSLINSGVTSFVGLSLTDDLGGYEISAGNTVYPLSYVPDSVAYFVNGEPQEAPAVTTDPTLVITGINVPAGGNALIIYQADVTDFAPLEVDGTITNTATVLGLAEDVSDSATVSTLNEPNLSITKSLDPLVVGADGAITYTFDIQNTGNTAAVATDDVVVTDVFDPVLDITSVTLNGTPLTLGEDYTYDEATGEFATVAGVITVPAAEYVRETDGSLTIIPGSATLVVNGTI